MIFMARVLLRRKMQCDFAAFKIGVGVWWLKNCNLASALSALPVRASSQVRSNNAGTAFSKPGKGPSFELKMYPKQRPVWLTRLTRR